MQTLFPGHKNNVPAAGAMHPLIIKLPAEKDHPEKLFFLSASPNNEHSNVLPKLNTSQTDKIRITQISFH